MFVPGSPDLTWLSSGLGGGWARKGLGYLQSRSGEKGRGRGSLSMPLGSWMGGTFMSLSAPLAWLLLWNGSWELRLRLRARELRWGILSVQTKSMIAKTLDCRFIKSECIRGNTGGNSGYKQILRKKSSIFCKEKKLQVLFFYYTNDCQVC